MAPKTLTIIYYAEHGKPYAFLVRGIDPARGRNGAEGKGKDKKRTPSCNGADRGSNFAPT
jgi:hypothetical protein